MIEAEFLQKMKMNNNYFQIKKKTPRSHRLRILAIEFTLQKISFNFRKHSKEFQEFITFLNLF